MQVLVKTNSGSIKCHTDTPLMVPSKCRTCKAEIYWVKTENDKLMPVEFKDREWISHFATCKQADFWRKKSEWIQKDKN